MFEIPGSDVIAVTVTKEAVEGVSPPDYTYKKHVPITIIDVSDIAAEQQVRDQQSSGV